jgi:hypothetical protein
MARAWRRRTTETPRVLSILDEEWRPVDSRQDGVPGALYPLERGWEEYAPRSLEWATFGASDYAFNEARILRVSAHISRPRELDHVRFGPDAQIWPGTPGKTALFLGLLGRIVF